MDTLNINYDDFNTNLCDGLQSILNSSEMSDVTLAVEGKHFKAHQVILSMFSTYFRELFHVTPSRNTIFFMKNVKHRIMHNLLVFIYEGKVQIPSEDFQMFVDTATELKIKGLTNDMDPKAANISRGQVNNADNIEHAIAGPPLLKRASEPMKQTAKKHKSSNNEPDQSTSEASDLTLETNKHIRGTEYFNMYGIKLKEEVTDTIDPTEIFGLDDKTNELDGDEDNTKTPKESILPLASSQIDHPIIGEIDESDIGDIHSSEEDYEENLDLVDVGPTEIYGLVDGTIKSDGNKGENTMTMGNDKDVQDSLVATDQHSLPPLSKGKPVTVSLCLSRTTKTVNGVIWDDFRYYFRYKCKLYSSWHCAGYAKHRCTAMLTWAEEDDLITMIRSHNHGTCRILNQSAINLEARTLYAVSNDYFGQHVMEKCETSEAGLRETEDVKMYGIQLKEEDTIDVDSIEIYGLDDKTNDPNNADTPIICKESVLPLASSQINHLVFGEMDVSDGIQTIEEDTEAKIELVDVGSTERHDLVDETLELDGHKEDNTMTMRNDEDENDFLVAINHDPLPPSEGVPVTVTLCLSRTTNKVMGVIWGDFRYTFKYECKSYGRWRCTGNGYKCKAKLLWDMEDGLITMTQSHNHENRRIFNKSAINLEYRTLHAVSNKYFRQHVMRKGQICSLKYL